MTEPQRHPVVLAEGGDAACWLGRVCPECGALDESPRDSCPRCGAELPE